MWHMPKYSLSALLLVIALAVVHVNSYILPHSMLARHIVLISYLCYGAWQYKKHMHWNYRKFDRRKSSRDGRVPTEIYGRLRAEELIKANDVPLKLLLEQVPANSPDYIKGYKERIQEEINKGV